METKTTTKRRGITLARINDWFKSEGFTPRHNLKSLKWAVNEFSKEVDLEPYDLFLLLVANKEISGAHTHSYGFHTSNGRYMIDSMARLYFISEDKHNRL